MLMVIGDHCLPLKKHDPIVKKMERIWISRKALK